MTVCFRDASRASVSAPPRPRASAGAGAAPRGDAGAAAARRHGAGFAGELPPPCQRRRRQRAAARRHGAGLLPPPRQRRRRQRASHRRVRGAGGQRRANCHRRANDDDGSALPICRSPMCLSLSFVVLALRYISSTRRRRFGSPPSRGPCRCDPSCSFLQTDRQRLPYGSSTALGLFDLPAAAKSHPLASYPPSFPILGGVTIKLFLWRFAPV